MKLESRLNEYTKDDLLVLADNFKIKVSSRLKKAEMIDALVAGMSNPEIMRPRLACLTDSELALLKRAIEEPQDIGADKIMDGMQLFIYCLGEFEEETDNLVIYDEIKEVYAKVEDEDFLSERKKKGWLMKCLRFFREYYGVAPLEVIYKLYHLKVKDSIVDMVKIFLEIPLDIRGCTVFPEDELQVNEAGIDKYLHTEYGLLVNLDIFENEEVYPLLRSQVGKDFYIPSAAQIEEITHDCYESSSLAYKKLHTFFMKKLYMESELATTWCLNVWMNSYNGDSPTEIIKDLNEHDAVFDGEDQIGEFMNLLMDAHNNTRLIENRGHKPVELHSNNFTGIPTIVPGSSKAASILGELQPQLSAMGIPVELGKKVYPNDPCPCGSGKKYKKCCGR